MNDRYLYKAKRVDNKEWVTGSLIVNNRDDEVYIGAYEPKESTIGLEWNIYIVDPKTLCQCAGLKDENGKLIWENDIVGYVDMYSTESGYAEMNCAGEVLWDKETMSFQVTNRLSAESYEVLQECLILGNIFDDPELL